MLTNLPYSYIQGRIEADRKLWWREFARDVGCVALFLVCFLALLVWALSPMPPVVP